MWLKKGKENLVKDLRAMNLIESNFNFNNDTAARIAMKCAQNNH